MLADGLEHSCVNLRDQFVPLTNNADRPEEKRLEVQTRFRR
jgi:hypothetical protein